MTVHSPPPTRREVLLAFVPWDLPSWFTDSVSTASPGIEVIGYRCGMYDKDVPPDIPEETWQSVTVFLTWNVLPAKELVPNLRYVQLLTAGCNHVAGNPLFEDTDIQFCTANGVHPPQIAEWVITTYLSFQHHIFDHWDNQRIGKWVMPESDEDTEDAVGMRMGVLGYGCIGRQCAKLGQALGMDVHAFTLREKATLGSRQDDTFVEEGMGDPNGEIPSKWFHGAADQLHEFLGSGLDLLIITLPLTSLTRSMIGKEQLQILEKKHAFLANVSRGPIVKTDDLVEALNDGTLKGAALDVTDPEPLPPNHPLWKARNVIITPHVSGNSTHYNERVLKILRENLRRRYKGEDLINKVDRSLGY